jgi:hypothetical protein
MEYRDKKFRNIAAVLPMKNLGPTDAGLKAKTALTAPHRI